MKSTVKEPLRAVSAEELAQLARISRSSSERLDRVQRARALLAVAQGTSLRQAAQQVGWRSHTGVAKLIVRFNQRGLAALAIASGRGRQTTYDVVARGRVVALAQEQPRRREDHTASWSLSTLQRRLRQEPGLERLGTSTIRRVLHDAGSSYQRTRTWCPTGTALRQRKDGVVQVSDPDTEEKKS